jgi:hypothetical protein
MPIQSSDILRVDLKPSYWLAGALGAVHVLALVCVWLSLNEWPRHLVATGVLVSGLATVVESMMWRRAVAVSLELHPDGSASWKDGYGAWHEAQLGGDYFVSVPLIVLGLKQGRLSRKWIVVMPDSARTDGLRRLRTWLRLKTEADPDGHKGSTPPRNPAAG